jgi:hypothetical protein
MTSTELEYRGYWILVWTRSRLGGRGIEFATEVSVTADSWEVARRQWTPVSMAKPPGFKTEADALEDAKRRGFVYVDALAGLRRGGNAK